VGFGAADVSTAAAPMAVVQLYAALLANTVIAAALQMIHDSSWNFQGPIK
jgi:hypothetical protein